MVVPPGARHRVWNAGRGGLHATVEMRPAAPRFREFPEAGAALPQGPLGLLEGARLLHEYRDVILPASPPEPMRRVGFPALSVAAELVRVLDRRHAGRGRSPGEARGPARTYRLTAVRRLVNRAMAAGLRFGVEPRATYLLTTRGRRSGKPHTTPVTLLEEGDGGRRRWLVAPYGEVDWVKNARAAGRVTRARAPFGDGRGGGVGSARGGPRAQGVCQESAHRPPVLRRGPRLPRRGICGRGAPPPGLPPNGLPGRGRKRGLTGRKGLARRVGARGFSGERSPPTRKRPFSVDAANFQTTSSAHAIVEGSKARPAGPFLPSPAAAPRCAILGRV